MTLSVRAVSLAAAAFLAVATASAQTPTKFPATEGDYIAHNFKFKSGEELPEMRLHYRTLGKPDRDAQGTRIAALVGSARLIPLGAGLSCRTNRSGPE